VRSDVVSDAFAVLLTLGHSESDARKLLDAALASKRRYRDVEDLLHAIYQHSHR
jgi:Holliday junction DNA helicase RuvA